ncbi:hypothetical protein [Paenibacillus gansuensis]|uniref:Uncharacterized protein n=1 Tax=Paenibacillus gansuensis TaxID=306542 RepID=A0ABW5PGB0_9BACL
MKTNRAMSELLAHAQTKGSPVDDDYLNFIEREGCILIKSFCSELPIGFPDTAYFDQTDCEASINHVHLESLSEGLNLVQAWENKLRFKYPAKAFVIVLKCDPDGTDVVARFFQYRESDPTWLSSDLESYKSEALLVREIT